jgi:hypothetical protein
MPAAGAETARPPQLTEESRRIYYDRGSMAGGTQHSRLMDYAAFRFLGGAELLRRGVGLSLLLKNEAEIVVGRR